MYRCRVILSAFVFLFVTTGLTAQELNSQVIVNADQTGNSSLSVFRNLQNFLQEFINQNRWTDREFLPYERINCSFFINISSHQGNTFSGTLQVQASRPVFGSTMITPVFNFNDENFTFDYSEYAPLDYNPSEFESNLVSVISFYVYTILGLDADTFEEMGGTEYYEEANRIVSTAQQSSHPGWRVTDGSSSRFQLNSDLLSSSYSEFRKALYNYHRRGLDLMHMSPESGKKGVAEAILLLDKMNSARPNSLLVRTFFDAKADEIEQIFSGGPRVETSKVVEALHDMAPTFSENWSNIRY